MTENELIQRVIDALNIDGVTVPLFPDAGPLSGSDILYLIQGLGADRDRTLSISRFERYLQTRQINVINILGTDNERVVDFSSTQAPVILVQATYVSKLTMGQPTIPNTLVICTISSQDPYLTVPVHGAKKGESDTSIYQLSTGTLFIGVWGGSYWTWIHCPTVIQPLPKPNSNDAQDITSSATVKPSRGKRFRLIGQNVTATLPASAEETMVLYFEAFPATLQTNWRHSLIDASNGREYLISCGGPTSVSNGASAAMAVFTSGHWLVIGSISSSSIRDGSIGTSALAYSSVTGEKIADSAVLPNALSSSLSPRQQDVVYLDFKPKSGFFYFVNGDVGAYSVVGIALADDHGAVFSVMPGSGFGSTEKKYLEFKDAQGNLVSLCIYDSGRRSGVQLTRRNLGYLYSGGL